MSVADARRSLVLREDDRARIFSTRTPQSFPTFLPDGEVAGTWKHVDGRVELDPWRPIPARIQSPPEEEASRLTRFYL